MGHPHRAQGSHGAREEGPNDRGWRSDQCGLFIDPVRGFSGNLRREVMGGCGGVGVGIKREATRPACDKVTRTHTSV